jgi:hypothetical protein
MTLTMKKKEEFPKDFLEVRSNRFLEPLVITRLHAVIHAEYRGIFFTGRNSKISRIYNWVISIINRTEPEQFGR